MSARTPLALVLAGGRSSRFGRDKAAEPVLGTPSLTRVLAACQAVLGPDGAVVHDQPSDGPLGAVVETARRHPGRALIVLACDLPLIDAATVARLAACGDDTDGDGSGGAEPIDAWVPRVDGRAQPLAARYTARGLTALAAAWDAGERSIVRALAGLRVAWLDDLPAAALSDFDTPEDLAALVAGVTTRPSGTS